MSSILDRVIERLSPGWAFKREISRMRVDYVRKARGYDAARPSRLRRTDKERRGADLVGEMSVEELRAIARNLDENNDIATSILDTMVAQILGRQGIRTIPMARKMNGDLATEFNETIRKLFKDWAKHPEATGELNWVGVQDLLCRSWLRDGEGFGQMLMGNVPDLRHGSVVAMSLSLFEADHVPVIFSDGLRNIRQGVEKNRWGQPIAYHVLENHPGDIGAWGTSLGGASSTSAVGWVTGPMERIEADRIIHAKLMNRIGQTRGISLFAAIFKRLQDLGEFEEAEQIAAKIGASFAFAIQRDSEFAGASSVEEQIRMMEQAPGMIFEGEPGDTVQSLKNERPNNQIASYKKTQLQSIAGGTKSGYSSIAKDYDGNYSSQRQELLEQNVIYGLLRTHFTAAVHDKIYRRLVEMAILQGEVSTAGIDPMSLFDAEHRGGGTPYIDPGKEADAEHQRMQDGTTSRRQIQLERGEDPEEVDQNLQADRASAEKHGLVLTSDPAWQWNEPKKQLEITKAKIRSGLLLRGEFLSAQGIDVKAFDQKAAEEMVRMDELGLVFDTDPRKVSQAGLTQGRPAGTELVPPEVPDGEDSEEDEGADGGTTA